MTKSLLVVVLLHDLLGLLLGGLQQRAHKSKRLLRQDKTGGDHSLTTGEQSIPPTLLILGPVQVHQVSLRITHQANGAICSIVQRGSQLLCVLLDDGEPVVNARQSLVTQRICFN